MKTIFIVTVMSSNWNRYRTWGWYPDQDMAKKAVLVNATDMFEAAYYRYAVIEEVPCGICVPVIQELWFFADYESMNPDAYDPIVREISKPAEIADIVNFGMG